MPASRHGVYNREQLTRAKNVSVQGEITSGQSGDVAVIAQTSTKYTLVILRIILNVYTSAAQPFSFQSDGAGGDPVFSKAASPALGEHRIDWGDLGYILPAGEGLEVALGGTGGNAFTYLVEAYLAPAAGAVLTPSEIIG